MDQWLTDFIARNSASASVAALSEALVLDLNRDVPEADRLEYASGFHVAGLRVGDDEPEFWSISNLLADGAINPRGYSANDDFQGRDVAALPPDATMIYRNGDLRVHAQTWAKMDEAFRSLIIPPDFAIGSGPQAHMRWVGFKMETLVRFYEQFATVSIIGKPVDLFAITTSGVLSPPRRQRVGRTATGDRTPGSNGR